LAERRVRCSSEVRGPRRQVSGLPEGLPPVASALVAACPVRLGGMPMSRLLDRAAAAYGIERAFIDNGGRLRIASPEIKRALLAAMGVDTGSVEALREALARATQAEVTPPVMVATAGEDAAIVVPAVARATAWQLTLESGEELAGRIPKDGGRSNRLLLPAPLPPGYHRLVLERGGRQEDAILLIATPGQCLMPEELGLDRVFGLGCQTYSLRTGRDLGSGDLADLAELAERGAAAEADFVAVSPLHALFFAEPGAASPYAPSHRAFLNWLLIAPDHVREVAGEPELMAALERLHLEPGAVIDYPATAAYRQDLLERAFARFRDRHLRDGGSARGAAFLAFRDARGEVLFRHCLFDALHEHQLATDRSKWAWWQWPEGYRRPDSAQAQAFAAAHADRLTFFAWLQWLADEQLGSVQAQARAAGMRLGLLQDLAVGVNPAGSLAWSTQGIVVRQASIGAPPDGFSPKGQNWGLAPLAPRALEAAAYGPWLADIRANMRHAGALRIDHVMGLRRLFWVPEGGGPEDGAYVRYPFTTMAAILAVESHRARCLVVGEDLGTLPRGFRPALRRAGILSSRVFYFERERNGGFGSARRYRRASVASVATHDLPTLRGFLEERDIDWRDRLALFPSPEEAEQARADRRRDRLRVARLLQRAGLLEGDETVPELPKLALALHRWLAQTPAALLLVQMEDLALAAEQPNLPGAQGEHPNWRRRLETDIETLLDRPFARSLLALLREERPRGSPSRNAGKELRGAHSVLLDDGG
jgi:4-alpha-glucanotransferase